MRAEERLRRKASTSHVALPPADRGAYDAFCLQQVRRTFSLGLLVGILTLVSLVLVDYHVIPDVFEWATLLRLGVGMPVLSLAMLAVRHPPRPLSLGAYHAISSLVAIFVSCLVCAIVLSSGEPIAAVYLTGNNITLVFALLIFGNPPKVGAATGLAIIAIQALMVLIYRPWDLELAALLTVLSLAMFFPALFGNWKMERDRRREFLARKRDASALRHLTLQNELLKQLSAVDALTGISNRRAFDVSLTAAHAEALARRRKGDNVLGLAFIDIDHFKPFNDRLGHPAGDEALKQVATTLANATEHASLVARYGGEEFVAIFPHVPAAVLHLSGLALHQAIASALIPHPANGASPILTVSIGIAYVEEAGLAAVGPAELTRAADEALYEAKAAGRNGSVIRRLGTSRTASGKVDRAGPRRAPLSNAS